MFYCRAGDEFVDLFGQFPVVHGVGKVVASGGVARIDVDRDVDDELLPVEARRFEYAVVTVTADSGQCDRVVMVQFAHLSPCCRLLRGRRPLAPRLKIPAPDARGRTTR